MNISSITFLTTAAISLIQLPVAAQSGQPFELSGRISTADTSATAYLIHGVHTQPITDSVRLIGGAFRFTGYLPGEEKAYLLVNHAGPGKGTRDVLELFVAPGVQALPSADSVSHIRFDPGTASGDYQLLQRTLQPLNTAIRQVSAAMKSAPGDSVLAGRRDSLAAESKETNLRFIKEHPGSIASVEALHRYAGPIPNVETVEPLYLTLEENVRHSHPGQVFAKILAQAKETDNGQVAPDFTQQTPEGKAVSLSSFRGKYVLVDFWASWCKPCREENPHVVVAYRQYQDRGFTVLGVSLDNEKGRQAWLKAIQDDELEWTQVSDLKGWKNEAAQLYGVRAIPQNFLVDPTGKIVGKNLRGDDLKATLRELLE